MKKKVLLITRKELYVEKLIKLLKKKSKLSIIWTEERKSKKKISMKYLKKKYDFVFLYRTFYILNKKELDLLNTNVINFHPSTPKYRGSGGPNFAILKKEKTFGVTSHLVSEKIDNGKIIDLKTFNISKLSLTQLFNKIYREQFKQATSLISKLLNNKDYLIVSINKNKNINWSKKIITLRELKKIYLIKKNITKKKITYKSKSYYL